MHVFIRYPQPVSVSKLKKQLTFRGKVFSTVMLYINVHYQLFSCSMCALACLLSVFLESHGKWSLHWPEMKNGWFEKWLPSVQCPLWAALSLVYRSPWSMPRFACNLPCRAKSDQNFSEVSEKSILYTTNMEHLEMQSNRCWWGAWLVHRSIWQRCTQAPALLSGFLADSSVGRDVKYDSSLVWVRTRRPEGLFLLELFFCGNPQRNYQVMMYRKAGEDNLQALKTQYLAVFWNAPAVDSCSSMNRLFPKNLFAAILQMKSKDSCLDWGSHTSLFHSLLC